jgi:two-component sensor histidine kinase
VGIEDLPPETKMIRQLWRCSGLQSLLIVPIIKNGQIEAALQFASTKKEKHWFDEDIGLLTLVGDSFLYALARHEAEQALRQRIRQLQVLFSISQDILSAREPQAVALAALNGLKELIACQRISAIEIDSATFEARALATVSDKPSSVVADTHMSFARSYVNALANGAIRRVPDLAQMPNPMPVERMLLDEGIRCFVQVPILGRDQLIGTLNLGSDRPLGITPAQEDIARQVAASLAIALQQARLHEQTRHDAETTARLLEEVNHRVKNNLASIIGLLHVEKRFAPEHEQGIYREIVIGLSNRIHGMSTVHNMLSAAEWTPLPLPELVAQVVGTTLQTAPADIQTDVDVSPSETRIRPKQANSLGLILNELTTNAIKHMASNQKKLQIQVTADQTEDRLRLVFRDNGPGYPVDTLNGANFHAGLSLVSNIVRNDLHGKLDLSNQDGACTSIEFDLQTD